MYTPMRPHSPPAMVQTTSAWRTKSYCSGSISQFIAARSSFVRVSIDDDAQAGVFEHLEWRPERRREDVRDEHLAGRPDARDPLVETHEVGKVGGDAVEVVGRQHDGQPVGVQVAQEVHHLVAGLDVDAGRRL